MPLRPVVTACLLAGVTLLLYGFRLAVPPVGADEAVVLHEARLQHDDADGSRTPLFFRVNEERWLLPIPVYATATVRALGGGEASARLATVIVAALDVALLWLCARMVFGADLPSLGAAALLLLMPAHLAFGRSGSDSIYAVPFAVAASMAMLHYLKTDRLGSTAIAGALLGLGMYTHPAAPLTMAFLAVFDGVLLVVRRRRAMAVIALVSGFATLLLPAVVWFALHPQTYRDTFGRWLIHLAHLRNPLEGLDAFLNWNTLGSRASLYWGFLDPAWLFFDRTGMFLLGTLPLLIVGLAKWPRAISQEAMLLIAGGVLIAPLAGSSFGAPHYASSALVLLPFAALIMTGGLVSCARPRSMSSRVVTAILGLLIAMEGAAVYARFT